MKNKIKPAGLLFAIILLQFSLIGQTENKEIILTGSLYADSKIISEQYQTMQNPQFAVDDVVSKKTPLLSGLFSAIIPGAGQFYNEDYWIAGIFVAVEAAVITTAVIYDKKGDDKTIEFENFADANWSVVKYAEYINANNGENPDVYINPDESLPPWERVDWTELNAAETGSHHLAPHGEQQYYEMIGKYPLQFSIGWAKQTPTIIDNGFVIPLQMHEYAVMRGDANDFYTNAKTAVIGIYINHLLSAVEAVWGAVRFNNDIAIKMRVENINLSGKDELVPTLNVKYSF